VLVGAVLKARETDGEDSNALMQSATFYPMMFFKVVCEEAQRKQMFSTKH
jgi:hypothetical protein